MHGGLVHFLSSLGCNPRAGTILLLSKSTMHALTRIRLQEDIITLQLRDTRAGRRSSEEVQGSRILSDCHAFGLKTCMHLHADGVPRKGQGKQVSHTTAACRRAPKGLHHVHERLLTLMCRTPSTSRGVSPSSPVSMAGEVGTAAMTCMQPRSKAQ